MRAIFALFLLFLVADGKKSFRVASFNLWQCGNHVEKGLDKIIKHIKVVDADVFSFQEVQNATAMRQIVDALPDGWTAVFPNSSYPNIGILTKHPIVPESVVNTSFGVHATIKFDSGFSINFWAFHGFHKAYGPHAAFNKLVTNVSQIISGEYAPKERKGGRVQNIQEVTESATTKAAFKRLKTEPIFILGDFNTPSHQDWVEANKPKNGGWAVEWPATKHLTDLDFLDAYRELHPDPMKEPGYSWSPVAKTNYEWDFAFPEPQDRIDFIFYKGPVKPTNVTLYSGSEPLKMMPDHFYNDYPSDHSIVIGDFEYLE
ncbi:unnamed protein product, partial [Mesorhabditis spiculigera]